MIKLYSINNCNHCLEAKKYLNKKGIKYTEINLSSKENGEYRKYYRSLGIKEAPIITGTNKNTDKDWIIFGFEEDKKTELDNMIKDSYE